jgi:hypothetical protein
VARGAAKAMRAKLNSLSCTDLPDLQKWTPEDLENFGFMRDFYVGQVGDNPGEDRFTVTVCTPKWLIENHRKTDVVSGRLRVIMFEYNYDRLRGFLENYINGVEEETWPEIAEKIGRISSWEFENFKPWEKRNS